MNRREYSSSGKCVCRPVVPARLLRAAGFCILVLALSVLRWSPASAQNTTLNQTTCFGPGGPANCQAAGNLQTVVVDCNAGGRIDTALASIQDREGPNRIQVSGTCGGGLIQVTGFDRLTIAGNPSATF